LPKSTVGYSSRLNPTLPAHSFGIRTDSEKFETHAEGTIENVDGQLLLTNVSVTYRIKVPKDQRAATERALEHHESRCPVSQSVKRGITVQWRSEIEEESAASS
jgi:organic hydroperoxide reductase OsmC/OhrA